MITDVMLTMEINRLIERCRQGDADALGELYKAYATRMRGVCRRYISDEQTVNDVLHDAFVIIFTSFDKLRDDSKAEAWMMAITRNVASKFKDHQKVRRTVSIDEANETLLMADSGVNDVMGISFSEVSGLIDRLPEGYGRVFRLSVFEGLTHKEIATTLGIEPHSSSSQLARAKKMLRKMLRQYWAVLLVLLVPLALLLFRKEETPVEAGKTPKTPSTTATGQPMHSQTATTQRPTPATNRPTPTNRSVCCGITATKPCTQQPPLPIAQSTDTTASDSLQRKSSHPATPARPTACCRNTGQNTTIRPPDCSPTRHRQPMTQGRNGRCSWLTQDNMTSRAAIMSRSYSSPCRKPRSRSPSQTSLQPFRTPSTTGQTTLSIWPTTWTP